MAVLSDEEARVLANIAGFLQDDQARARVSEMRAAAKEADDAASRLKMQQATNEKAARDAHDRLDAALEQERANRSRADELDRREKTMAEALNALNAEKAAWEAVRQRVDAEQKAKAEQLLAEERRLTALADQLHRDQEEASARNIGALETIEKYKGLMDELRAIVGKWTG